MSQDTEAKREGNENNQSNRLMMQRGRTMEQEILVAVSATCSDESDF